MSLFFFPGKTLTRMLFLAIFAVPLLLVEQVVAQQTVLFEEHFDDGDWAARGWYDSPDMITDSGNRVGSSGSSAVFTWAGAGQTTAASRGGRVKFDPVEGFTMSCYMKFSDNWEWTGLGFHPHLNLFMTNRNGDLDGPAFSHLTTYVEIVDGVPKLLIQDGQNIDQSRVGENLVGVTEMRSAAGGNGDADGHGGGAYLNGDVYWNNKYWSADTVLYADDPGPYYKNDWHKVTAHFQLNSIIDGIGVANGVIQLWYDDSLLIDHHDVLYRTGRYPNMKFDQYMLLPYYGPGVPHSQSFWIDELTIVQDEQELPAVPPPVQSFLLFEEDFDNSDWASKGWYDEPAIEVDANEKVGETGSAAIFNWSAQGNTTPNSRGGRNQFSLAEGITLSYDIKFGDNWSFAGDTLLPPSIFTFTTSEDGTWANPVSTHMSLFLDHLDGGINIGMRDMLNIDSLRWGEDLTSETEIRAVAGGNGSSDSHRALSFTRNGALFNLKHIRSEPGIVSAAGGWQHVQAHIQLNSIVDGIGVANGVARIRLDGELVLDKQDILYRTAQFPEMKFNQLMFLPYLVGGVPGQQKLWIDNLLIEKEERDLPVPVVLSSDFNGDGNMNVIDALCMVIAGRTDPQDFRLDRDSDGTYSALDVIDLIKNILSTRVTD
jgi:hypothetical protein